VVQHWVRFEGLDNGKNTSGNLEGFGTLTGETIAVYQGNMFSSPQPAGRTLNLRSVKLLSPTQPSKIIALWNNFMALAKKLDLQDPTEPLYFIKSPNSYLNPFETIRKPSAEGKIIFEGELGVVIGKTCTQVSEAQSMDYVFGYTCANDVTHADILTRDATFMQWVRAKGFDTFCPFGPVVATGLDADTLVVKTLLNGDVRQQYPINDMRFKIPQLIAMLSHDMTLYPGDIILCGTSLGVGSMKPGSQVIVDIEGIGQLSNRFE
jgi:2-keto-4-pentenoate hydratase/2-oxohepta-3-ene-1,7-dioic acid hydratase in catechol pathway